MTPANLCVTKDIILGRPLAYGESKDREEIPSVRLGNANGQCIEFAFMTRQDVHVVGTHPFEWTGFALGRLSVREGRQIVERYDKLPENYLDQLYAYAHVELFGCCLAGTCEDEASMKRLDKVEVHVDTLMNSELDVSADRNARLLSLEQKVQLQEQQLFRKRPLEAGVESPAKQQKVEGEKNLDVDAK